ncbi:anti-sigma factor [Paenibacillus sp. NEAU-GSW1]|uniref:anti-sigma factor n=1 Tax=Paenibacillus sp. NEAU-GSW1 TaxID=2682486 RepID=UPI0012E25206|nr:anti-sigma factor [Paenibacillus sp. NEAU-GSW1]MUT64838.1 hypothetical protein [Paenibacillus sp. NEAU-GSW1]
MRQQNGHSSLCDLCLDYISGVCTDEETVAFERHLPGCADCQAEIDELRLVWEELPSVMERIEPPADLKKQVMDAAMAEEAKADAVRQAKKTDTGRRRRKFWAIAAAALVVFVAGTGWNYQLYRERTAAPVIPLEQALSVSAARIEQLVTLKPQSEKYMESYAVACIVDNGYNKQFVVYVFGAKSTVDDSVYQVWLNDGAGRQSAGTFRVNDRGIGVLAMPVSADKLVFDSILITLEPDESGSFPRGEEIYGSA